MCGRYALYGPHSRFAEQFGLPPDFGEKPRDLPNPFVDRYNIAPSQLAPVVAAGSEGVEVVFAKWGLVPGWAAGKDYAAPINAKIETAAEKPMFRHAWKRGRVIVPASGFYEWQPTAGGKQPHFIKPLGVEYFGFAGLLEHADGPDGPEASFAILTTAANDLMQPIHGRMPVILSPQAYSAWLDPGVTGSELLREIAGQYPSELMTAYKVGRAVGNPKSQGPVLVQPI